MPALLHLDSSADLQNSVSRGLTGLFADTWRALGAEHTVLVRDLHRSPLPHLPDAGCTTHRDCAPAQSSRIPVPRHCRRN